MKSEKEIVSFREGLRRIKDRWDEIEKKLDGVPQYLYPFPRSLVHHVLGIKTVYSYTPTIATLNKAIEFMKWEFHVRDRIVNKNIKENKRLDIKYICDNFNKIQWHRESWHLLYFFKDTVQKGYISDIYPAPGIKALNRLKSIIESVQK